MTIEIQLCADDFTRNGDPKLIEQLDLDTSFRTFELLLETELERIHRRRWRFM